MQKIGQTDDGHVQRWISQQLMVIADYFCGVVCSPEFFAPCSIDIGAAINNRIIQRASSDRVLLAGPSRADDAQIIFLGHMRPGCASDWLKYERRSNRCR